MRTTRLIRFVVQAAMLALAFPSVATAANAERFADPPRALMADNLVDQLDRVLKPTETQKPDVDRIVGDHERQIAGIRSDTTMSSREKRGATRDNLVAMVHELRPLLTPDQTHRLDDYFAPKSWFPRTYEAYVSYESYLPTDSVARSIFGDSPSAFGLGVHFYQPEIQQGAKVGWSLDFLSLINDSNSVFVLAPQLTVEQYVPIGEKLWAFGKLSAGPAYFDYAFDTPDGVHHGAKRIGGDGDAQVGLRYGPVELAATYRLLSQPTGVNFSGIQLSLTWYVFHFRI